MQYLAQTQTFYKSHQTRLTWTKRDLINLDNPDDPTRFQP